jgi:hypothetical protein
MRFDGTARAGRVEGLELAARGLGEHVAATDVGDPTMPNEVISRRSRRE